MKTSLLCCLICIISGSFAAAWSSSDASISSSLPLVLCNGLNASQRHVRALELADHTFPGSLLESNCVGLDVCSQVNSRAENTPMGVWMWRNSSVLRFDGQYTDDVHGTREQADLGYHNTAQFHDNTSYNYHAIEFARIPEGVKLEVCEPDFYRLRSGLVECNPNSLVVIDKLVGFAGCPSSTANYSLLDCMLSVERNHPIEKLPYRPKNERMAFGSETWYTVCRDGIANNLTAEARHLCSVLETTYELRLPLASAYSRVQLVRYSFSAGYGCFDAADVTLGQRLSRELPPNIVLECQDIEHGFHVASTDATKCAYGCDSGYVLAPDGTLKLNEPQYHCELGCYATDGQQLTAVACDDGQYAAQQCTGNGVVYYQCVACPERLGSGLVAWMDSKMVCDYTPCPAGTYGTNNICHDCPLHTFTAESNQSICVSCDTNVTGSYQPQQGQTACVACFSGNFMDTYTSPVCPGGSALVRDFAQIHDYFARTQLYHYANMTEFCMQEYACLPCEPGSYQAVSDAACVKCATGAYQPNFQTTACWSCALGQTTTRTGAVAVHECVCAQGYF